MGKLRIYICSGAACDNPIFYWSSSKLGRFSFDTYGTPPPNWKKWNHKASYGACGLRGRTNDMLLLVGAIQELNKMDRVGQCEQYVAQLIEEAGFEVEYATEGFR